MAKYVSMRPKDALTGGAFQGGITTIKKVRLGYGYAEDVNPEVITMRLTHVPKATGEERLEYLSCGNSCSKGSVVSKDGKGLVAKKGHIGGIHASSNAAIFLDSVVKAGFPDRLLGGDHGISSMEGLKFKAKQRPIKREGLDLEDESKPKTVLVCADQGIITLPDGGGKGSEDDDDEDSGDAEDSDDDDDDDDAAEPEPPTPRRTKTKTKTKPKPTPAPKVEEAEDEDEDEAEAKDEAKAEDEDEAEAEAEANTEEAEGEDEDEDGASDAAVIAHLKTVLAGAGGSLKIAKLGITAFTKLRKEKARNTICKRIVEDAFLAKRKGWTYDKKAGTVSLA